MAADARRTPAPEAVLGRVAGIVAGIAGPDRTPPGAGPDTPLGDHGYWLDSMDVLEVILACEREFGIALDQDEDLTAESLKTVRALGEVILGKLS